MGDPKKQRRKFSKPMHPWRMDRIGEENELIKKYGLKNKREIWKAKSQLRRIRRQARILLGSRGAEADKQAKDLTGRLKIWGVLKKDSLEDVLALTINDLLDRRLQTMVHAKGLANTVKQARQRIVHGHVKVGGHVVNVPGYQVLKGEEDSIKLTELKVTDVGRKQTKEEKQPEAA